MWGIQLHVYLLCKFFERKINENAASLIPTENLLLVKQLLFEFVLGGGGGFQLAFSNPWKWESRLNSQQIEDCSGYTFPAIMSRC